MPEPCDFPSSSSSYLADRSLLPPETNCDPHASDNDALFDGLTISVSTTFNKTANLLPIPTDLALISSDGVFFYVHIEQILSVSTNNFNNLIPSHEARPSGIEVIAILDTVVCVPEPADVLNVVLHSVYKMSCTHYNPPLDTLIAAVNAMPSYGMSPQCHVLPPLFDLILGLAPTQPLAVYALASRHDLFSLAQPVSSHLLSFSLDAFTDDLARTIAGPYLTKLFLLHVGRLDTLKQLLLPAPQLHPCTPQCDFAEQKKLARAWALAAGYLAWDARADTSPGAIESALSSLTPRLSCELCKRTLAARIRDIIARWSSAQVRLFSPFT
ncbi:uncharacterized protein TRAVEDRAFT_34028 [Trametes versicolor FP-101664 SS1]|uniref:uncharacterized protein n=1 Tax=Trametes versicolor (strain FP-101664) TaxID=717944 RepID=UPI00046245C8|nr:uncharacterized protein TRAVEDRAFT_34028 [Trametes versicolor FP-101664 SS1]EIW62642.1 hypothetical protein TRAVEDRAFT_34028 [Trametes versicolor FP-101664 SS1]